jgi:phosphoribosylaminoimidazolecarboxamide formyltransferase/IMP cyclohydrolase
MMDGRVKTLHPAVHGGLLAIRNNPAHGQAMRAHGIRPIDVVVVNLYPFVDTVARGADFAACIEKHRYRRAGDDSLRRQEPRRCRRARRR